MGWNRTIERITKLCPASSLSILSRWKDRKFCSANQIAPKAITQLIELGRISPTTALALIGYQYSWPSAEMIQSAIASVEDRQQRKMLFNQALRYVEISGVSSQDWKILECIAAENGWQNWSLGDYLTLSERNERFEIQQNNESITGGKTSPDPPKNWDQIFAKLRHTSPESIQETYKKMRAGDPPYDHRQFVEEFFRRTPSGQEIEALEAVFSVPDFSLYAITQCL